MPPWRTQNINSYSKRTSYINWLILHIVPIWNVLMSWSIPVFLGETKVNDVNLDDARKISSQMHGDQHKERTELCITLMVYLICTPTQTHKKIIRFDIAMQKRFWVNKFHSINLTQKCCDSLNKLAQDN